MVAHVATVRSAATDRRKETEAVAVRQAARAVVNRSPVEDHEMDSAGLDPQSPKQIGKT